MKLLEHQVKFAKDYKGSPLLVHEGGTGKTVCAAVWLRDGRDSDALVVCPKKVKRKWQKSLKDWQTKATVLSKEEFKKHPLKNWSARVIDEADEFASPLFIAKKRSGLSAALYELVKAYPDTPTLLLTATPIRSNPWNLHSLLCFMGKYIDWKLWREKFFYLQYPDPYEFRYLTRPAYMPRPEWRQEIRKTLERYADIVLMKDCVADLPPVTPEYINVPTPKYIPLPDHKPFFDRHRHEQQGKDKFILEQGKEFRKVLVVAYYREQIEELEKVLSKDKPTFAVHGGVKDAEAIIEQAQDTDECYLIMQAGTGVGSDCDTFSCMVFASMSYAVRDFVQMKFRVRRIYNLHPVKHVYLFGGKCDKMVFDNVQLGKNFVPSEYHESA
jgi:superfamily II DNA or RNA helicase